MGVAPKFSVELLYDDIEKIAKHYGYGLLKGIYNAEPDVFYGIEKIKKNEELADVFLLSSCPDKNVALSFEINQEMVDKEMLGGNPYFFEFLRDVEQIVNNKSDKMYIFFASEWSAGDRIRFGYGSIAELIARLSMPGGWAVRYYDPIKKVMYDDDSEPFVFEVFIGE
ncbi:hypothetical protein Y5W_00159 [Alcanivorax sp. 521-1]|uniref:DUF695 domain-containing protein n=2 Tax=Alloalcanivorax profundimaris TaxID=2735259 RepID=A0ABS0ANP3_9GAMM|nr:hypothetical protein [Alloalcanivorax profundimaris]